jgi:hypothetical protein
MSYLCVICCYRSPPFFDENRSKCYDLILHGDTYIHKHIRIRVLNNISVLSYDALLVIASPMFPSTFTFTHSSKDAHGHGKGNGNGNDDGDDGAATAMTTAMSMDGNDCDNLRDIIIRLLEKNPSKRLCNYNAVMVPCLPSLLWANMRMCAC